MNQRLLAAIGVVLVVAGVLPYLPLPNLLGAAPPTAAPTAGTALGATPVSPPATGAAQPSQPSTGRRP